MGKTLKYVSEFSFPSDKGYSGSAGKTMVKGYARGGSCGPMKKADGGMVDDPRRPMMDRTVGEYINAVNRERAMEMADMMAAERAAALLRAPRRISQGLRSPRAEMARERAIMGEDAGYKKGGMAMRKQYPTNNGKPMISGPKAAPAPKADMLYSKKEVGAKNLLRDGKAPALPHAKGSVNMKSGGTVKKAMGGVMPGGGKMTQSQMQAAAQGGRPRGAGGPPPQAIDPKRPIGAQQAAMQGVRPRGVGGPPPQAIDYKPPIGGINQGVRPRGAGGPPPQAIDPKRPIGAQQAAMQGVRPRGVGGPLPQAINKPSSLTQSQMQAAAQGVRPRGVGGPLPQAINKPSSLTQSQMPNRASVGLGSAPNTQGLPPRPKGGLGQMPLRPEYTTPDLSRMQSRMPSSGGFMSGLSQLMGSKAPMPQPGQVGSATGSTPNIGGAPGRVMAKGGAAKVGKVMREFKAGELHSGSKSGPVVKSRKQAIAIGLSEARRGKK